MTMTELILNALDNFAKANRNRHQARAGSKAAADMAAQLAERLRSYNKLDYAQLKILAEMPNVAPGTSDAISQIYDMLHTFVGEATTLRSSVLENHLLPLWPLSDDMKALKSDELNILPAIKNWAYSGDWARSAEGNKISHPDYNETQWKIWEQMGTAVDEGITKLVEANNVWNGSRQYNDFLRAMRELQDMKSAEKPLNPLENDQVRLKYEQVLRLGQAYLAYKAGDRRSINQKGLNRIKAVNEIVKKLSALQMEEQSNYDLTMKRAKHYRQLEEEQNRQWREQRAQLEKLNAENDKLLKQQRAEKKRIEEIAQKRKDKNINAVAENPKLAVKAKEFLFDRKNVLKDEFIDAYQQLEAYQQLNKKKSIQPVEGFEITDKEERRIHKMYQLRMDLLSEENKQVPEDENTLRYTLGALYEIYIAPYYLTDERREELVPTHKEGSDGGKNKLYHELEETTAFKDYTAKILGEGGSEEYNKLLNDPQYQEEKLKELVAAGVEELRVVDNELKDKIEYLKEYKNVMKQEYKQYTTALETYINRSKQMDAWLGKPERSDSEIAHDECGLSAKQYEKIHELGHDLYGGEARRYYKSLLGERDETLNKEVASILYDIQYHPAFGTAGNEEPLPKELGSLERNGYLMAFDGVKEIDEMSSDDLSRLMHDSDKVKQKMAALHDEVEKSGVLSEETMEKERKAIKTSVNYLLDYKNSIYPKYVEERQKLDKYLNKAEALNRREEEMEKLGLSEKQDKKIKLLSGDVMKDFRKHMSMDGRGIYNANAEDGDVLNKTLNILCLTYFHQSFNEPGNTLDVPETSKKMKQAAEGMGKKFRETEQMKDWVQSPNFKKYWDLNLEKGRERLLTLHGDMKQQMDFMQTINKIGVANGLIPKANSSGSVNTQNNVKMEERKSVNNKPEGRTSIKGMQ